MAKRKIIEINEDFCNGCGECVPNCPEGAFKVIDGKVRLISDLFCDGLGACVGHCPQGALTVVEREAAPYDEAKVMVNIVKAGKNTILEHLNHLKSHGEHKFLQIALDYLKKNNIPVEFEAGKKVDSNSACGCPGAAMKDFRKGKTGESGGKDKEEEGCEGKYGEVKAADKSQLRQWPVQITLVPPAAPYFDGADLLIAADCVPFAYAKFHEDLLKGKIVLVGCPKLDDTDFYTEKFTEIFKENNIKSQTIARMEVPCCGGIVAAARKALEASGKKIPVTEVMVGIKGNRIK